jgi:Xaa-Pro aminopeptidase
MKDPKLAMGDIARLRQAIETGPFDAVLASSFENIRYAGDVAISTLKSLRERLGFLLWAKGHEPIFIICQVEEGYVSQQSWVSEIRSYKEFVTSPVDMAVEALRELGLEKGRIGLELEHLGGRYLREFEKALPEARFEGCESLFRRVRMIKTRAEIDALQFGFRGTANAMLGTFATTRIGEDEWSLSRRLAGAILHSGAEAVAFNHINAGPGTGFPHAGPTDYRVQKGDFVKADSGGWYHGEYLSNVGRTAKMGKPTTEEADIWKRLREIHHHLADMLRPGRTGGELFAEAARLHEKHGLPFPYAHNGHSIGLEGHEYPMIKPFEDTPFQPGMVCTVETRVRWVGVKGLHMEDLFEITEGAPILLSDAFDNEQILVV